MAISIPDRAWVTSQSIQDESKRLRYLEAVIMYKMDGTMTSDDDIAPLVVSTLWNVERNKKISQNMKWNSNAKKVKTVKTDENSSDSSVLYNNIYINNNTSDNKNITKDINILIQELKEECNNLWIIYEKKNERNFAKHILTAKDFWEFAEKIWQSRTEFAKNVIKASVLISYWKGACAWPMSIYQNYPEVYNKAVQQSQKQVKNQIPSF